MQRNLLLNRKPKLPSFFFLVLNNVKVFIPMYEPLEVSKCEKCGRVITEAEELIRSRRAKEQ